MRAEPAVLFRRRACRIYLCLVALCLALALAPPAAHATDVHGIPLVDQHAQDISYAGADSFETREQQDEEGQDYEADFALNGIDKDLVGRAAADITPLRSNSPINLNLAPGQTVYYVVENATLWGSFTNQSRPVLVPDVSDFGQLYGLHDEHRQRRRLELRDLDNDSVHEIRRRQSTDQSRTLYLSANTCLQPRYTGPSLVDTPQLEMYVSTSNQNPGPGQSNSDKYTFDEGFVNATIQASSTIFIGIHAPNATDAVGDWNFAVAASIDTPFFASNATSSAAFLVDTDSQSALLVSSNLTSAQALIDTPEIRTQWLNSTPPFSLFVVNASSTALNGVRRSTCGLSNIQVASARVSSAMIARNAGNNPKQQFHIEGLSPGAKYYAVLSYNGASQSAGTRASVAGGGGHVWQPFSFVTKQDANCKLIYDLPFCNDVAYAVPANASASQSDLVSFYDSGAQSYWQNFTNSLQQVACNTTSTAQYSLARNCTDCSRDYKTWLCAVTIPRCTDLNLFTESRTATGLPFTQPRNLAATQYINGSNVDLEAVGLNSSVAQQSWSAHSRLSSIDTVVKPGPYRELLPCIDLCYEMVKSCPSSLAFSCPRQRPLLLRSYGILGDADAAGVSLPCNRLGVDQPRRSIASRHTTMLLRWLVIPLLAVLCL